MAITILKTIGLGFLIEGVAIAVLAVKNHDCQGRDYCVIKGDECIYEEWERML